MAKFNPFRPNHIVRPGMFAGRIDELETIRRCLRQTKHSNPDHFLIEGERGIGKSSLLLFVEMLAQGRVYLTKDERFNFLVLSVELQTAHTQEDVIRVLAADLKRAIAEQDQLREVAKKRGTFSRTGKSLEFHTKSPSKFWSLMNFFKISQTH